MSSPRVLLGLTGLTISGGIAAVTRTIVRALDEESRDGRIERVDRVVLYEHQRGIAPVRGSERVSGGSQPKFALQLWLECLRRRPDQLMFDFVGLARSLELPLPFRSTPYSVFCHGIELARASPGTAHRRALEGANRLIANSQTTAAYITSEFPELADRVRVAPLCIDPRMTEIWSSHQDEGGADGVSRELSRAEPVVLIVSRMWSEERGKGHDELLEAWPAILEAVPGAELWMVGEGDDVPRLKSKASELGLGEAVRFPGRVSDDELARCYKRASLFAMPSRQEGFGLVYAEAMWHGVPCLASRDDAGAEVVRDEQTGVLVPYGDVAAIRRAISDLLSNPERLESLGEAARREARERFGYERFKSDFLVAMGLAEESA